MAIDVSETTNIEISTAPWDQVQVDAFVCPTNGHGTMSHYPASKLRELAGSDVETELSGHTPLAVGAAFVSSGGRLRARHIIHVPDTTEPGGPVLVEDVIRATGAVLVACAVKRFSTVAVPLMGAYHSGIPAEEAARAIHSEFKSHKHERPLQVLFMARDRDEVEVFELAMASGA